MQQPALLQRAKEQRPPAGFKKPDVAQFTPPEAKDAVDRVVAAGMKVMFSPAMREELQAEVQRDAPPAQKLAESVTGLMLTLDAQSQGGIPMAAIFPAALQLMGEGADVLTAAGQPVSQEVYNEAALMAFVLLGKKLGATEEQMMGVAQQAAGGEPQAPQAPAGEPQEGVA